MHDNAIGAVILLFVALLVDAPNAWFVSRYVEFHFTTRLPYGLTAAPGLDEVKAVPGDLVLAHPPSKRSFGYVAESTRQRFGVLQKLMNLFQEHRCVST